MLKSLPLVRTVLFGIIWFPGMELESAVCVGYALSLVSPLQTIQLSFSGVWVWGCEAVEANFIVMASDIKANTSGVTKCGTSRHGDNSSTEGTLKQIEIKPGARARTQTCRRSGLRSLASWSPEYRIGSSSRTQVWPKI